MYSNYLLNPNGQNVECDNKNNYFFCPDCYDKRFNNNNYVPQAFDNTYLSYNLIQHQMAKPNPYSINYPTPNELFYAFPKGHIPKAPKNHDKKNIDNILRNTIVPKKKKKKIRKNKNKDLSNIFAMLFLLFLIYLKY